MLIGICGQSGSGKDRVADHLCANYRFVKVSFADPLKRICQDVFEFSDEQLWGPSEKRNEPDKRYLHSKICHDDLCPVGMVEGAVCNPETLEYVYLTPRYALQTLGTEWGRNCYSNVWVEYALRVAKKIESGEYIYSAKSGLTPVMPDSLLKANVVISDVRFKNEIDNLKKAGGRVFKIIRPGYEGKVGIEGHASEEEQKTIPDKEFDALIINSSTLDWLYTTVDSVMKAFVGVNKT